MADAVEGGVTGVADEAADGAADAAVDGVADTAADGVAALGGKVAARVM